LVLAALAGGLGTVASAQDVRTLGFGGALAPGAVTPFNPAYNAYPFEPGRAPGLVLPLGVLNLLLNPQMNVLDFAFNTRAYTDPTNDKAPEFNVLAAFDQVTHLNTLILNPVRAPRQLNVNVSAQSGVTLTDENGTVLNPSFSSSTGGQFASAYSAAGAVPFARVPFSVGPVSIGIGAFFSTRGPSLNVDPQLVADVVLNGGRLPPNKRYSEAVTGSAGASGGIAVDVAFAMPVALPTATLYVGARATAFYGLAYAEVRATGELTSGSDGALTNAQPAYTITTFLVTPGNGIGYGANTDVGIVADLPSATVGLPALERLTVGVGIVGVLDVYRWEGQERTTKSDGTGTTRTATREGGGFNPLVTLNAEARFSLDGGIRVLGLADVQFGRGAFSTHLGAEAGFGMLSVRGGLGFDNGLRFGLGASVDFAPNVGVDLALTTHQAPLYNHTNFGIALAVRLGF
jgi:hypothetical protein